MTGKNAIERNRAIVKKYKAGVKQSDIAKEFNISRQCVFKLVNKYKDKFGNPIYEKLLENNSTHIADREFNRYKKNPALIDELLKQEKQVADSKHKERKESTQKEIHKAERLTKIWKDVLNEYDLLTKNKK